MGESLPTIVITGASGFLGSRLVGALSANHRVIAIDRQPHGGGGAEDSPNVTWRRIDLADPASVGRVFDEIRRDGGAQALIHLAAYYDFTGESHPEYQRTNVTATRLVLENSTGLGLERFIFASSVAACDFTTPAHPITEATPPNGPHVYAVTKRAGEEMVLAHSDRLPTCIVRFAALFSDWCEYPPLYFFLETWLSDRWNARVLGGRGSSSIPYLHVRDAVGFVFRVMARGGEIDSGQVLIASTDGAVSHLELFRQATAYQFGEARKPLFVPRSLCYPGMWCRDALGRVLGNRPFERPWMAEYVDTELPVDGTLSRRILRWAPRERLGVLRRIPFMIENSRTSRMEWYGRNLDALEHHELRPRFRVYLLVRKLEAELGREIGSRLDALGDAAGSREERERTSRVALRSLIQAIRTGEKSPFVLYCRALAERQLERGAPAEVVVSILHALREASTEVLGRDDDAAGIIQVTIEFGIDQVLDIYEGGTLPSDE